MCNCCECHASVWVSLVSPTGEREKKMDTCHCWKIVLCCVRIHCIQALWEDKFNKLICHFSYLSASADEIFLVSWGRIHPLHLSPEHRPTWYLDVVVICFEDLRQVTWTGVSLEFKGGIQRMDAQDYRQPCAPTEHRILNSRGAHLFAKKITFSVSWLSPFLELLPFFLAAPGVPHLPLTTHWGALSLRPHVFSLSHYLPLTLYPQ